MDIRCRPMRVSDYEVIETEHWTSVDQVEEYIGRQGIASMLAFSDQRYLGQLYLQEYDPEFSERNWLAGPEPERIRALFAPRVRDLLRGNEGLIVQGGGEECLFYRYGRQLPYDGIRELVSRGMRIFRAMHPEAGGGAGAGA